jgi:hypothetical protein
MNSINLRDELFEIKKGIRSWILFYSESELPRLIEGGDFLLWLW